jgi:hypothetical protein
LMLGVVEIRIFEKTTQKWGMMKHCDDIITYNTQNPNASDFESKKSL